MNPLDKDLSPIGNHYQESASSENPTSPLEETTFVMIKPDGIRRGLIGEILHRFQAHGLRIVAIKFLRPDPPKVDGFYPRDKNWVIQVGGKTLDNYRRFSIDPNQELGTSDPYAIGLIIRRWLIEYITSAPVMLMAIRGAEAVSVVRNTIVGYTIPEMALPGSIRGDFSFESAISANRAKRAIYNLVHASETIEEARREIDYWFCDEELIDYKSIDSTTETKSISTYDKLAPEYDLPEHETTREFERLTREAWSFALKTDPELSDSRKIIELGCGTGSLTERVMSNLREKRLFVISDASRAMLRIACVKLRRFQGQHDIRFLQSSVKSLSLCAPPHDFDLVIAALSDPFFEQESLMIIRNLCRRNARFFFTLPNHHWAIVERKRAGIDSTTRASFRFASGDTCYSSSYTYSHESLYELMNNTGFTVLKIAKLSTNPSATIGEKLKVNPPSIDVGLVCTK